MAFDVCFAAFFEDMDMVRAVISAFGIEAPAGNAEFAPAVAAERPELRIMGVHEGNVLYYGHYIDDRFGGKTFDGSTADMVYSNAVLPQDLPDLFLFFLKHLFPFRAVVNDFNGPHIAPPVRFPNTSEYSIIISPGLKYYNLKQYGDKLMNILFLELFSQTKWIN